MKTKLFLATAILAVFSLTSRAQNPTFQLDWATRAGNNTTDKATGVAVNSNGDVVTVGYFNGNVDFNPGAGTYTLTSAGYDAFIQTLDASGNFISAYKLGTSNSDVINSVHIDASNNIYIGGYFTGTMDFDLTAGTNTLTCSVQSAFVAKYTPTLGLTWVKMITGTGTSYVNDITVDISGNVLSTGGLGAGVVDLDPNAAISNHTVSSGNSAYFIQRLSSAGNFSWAKANNGAAGTEGNSIITNSLNDVIIGGVFSGSVYMNNPTVNFSSVGGKDGFVLELSSSGTYSTSMHFGSAYDDGINAVKVDNSNNIYTCGYYSGTIDFDFGTGTSNLTPVASINNFGDAFFAKYTINGSYIYANSSNLSNTANADQAMALSVDGSQNVFVASEYKPSSTSVGLKLSKYATASTPTFVYGRTFSNASPSSLRLDASTKIYMVGSMVSSVDFNPTQYLNYVLSSSGLEDSFTAKFSECTTPTTTATLSGLNSICDNTTTATYSISPIASVTGYVWSNTAGLTGTSTTNTINYTSGGTYSVGIISLTGYNNCGNTPTFTMQITNSPNTSVTVSSSSNTVCSGKVVTLTASGTTSYSWNTGSTNANISPTPIISTTYTVTGLNGNCSNTKTITINVNSNPTISVNSGTICSGNTFTIVPSGGISYTYSSGSNTVSPSSNTSYTVVGSSAQGCTNTAISNIAVNSLPILTTSSTSSLMCTGETATITANGAASYTWTSFGSGASISVSPTTTTNYTVTGVSTANCSNTAVFTQSVSTCTGINNLNSINNLFVVYPNPNNGEFTITTTKGVYNIVNTIGAVVKTIEVENDAEVIDVKDLSQGIYYIIGKTAKAKIIITK